MKKLNIFLAVLIALVGFVACSKDKPEPQPEPSNPIEAKLTVNSVNYLRTESSSFIYEVSFKAVTNGTYTLSIENGEDKTFNFTQKYQSGTNYKVEISYKSLGVFNMVAEIVDSKGKDDIVQKTVNVDDKSPAITAALNYQNTDVETSNQRFALVFRVITKGGTYKLSAKVDQETTNFTPDYESDTEYVEGLTFKSPGEKTIVLTVTDAKGNVGTMTLTLTVEDRTPSINKWENEKGEVTVENYVVTAYNYKFRLIAKTFSGKTFKATLKINDEVKVEQEGLTSNEEITFNYAFATYGTYTAVIEVIDVDGNSNSQSIDVNVEEYVPDTYNMYNPFIQPYIHSRYLGKGELDFYGSGNPDFPGGMDINRDGVYDELDDKELNGEGEGYLLVARDYWNKNNSRELRREFCIRTHKLSNKLYLRKNMPGWSCGNYSDQSIINIQGIIDVEGWVEKFYSVFELTPEISTENNGLFNLNCYEISTNVDDSKETAHFINAYPIGDDLTKSENWVFIDGATATVVTPGSYYMKAGHVSNIRVAQTNPKYGNVRGYILEADIKDGYWENVVSYDNTLNLTR